MDLVNEKSNEAHFLDEHQQLFKQYMRDPKIWDKFYDLYEEIAFGSHDKLEYDEDNDYEEENYALNISYFIKDHQWDVGGQLDAVIDGIR